MVQDKSRDVLNVAPDDYELGALDGVGEGTKTEVMSVVKVTSTLKRMTLSNPETREERIDRKCKGSNAV